MKHDPPGPSPVSVVTIRHLLREERLSASSLAGHCLTLSPLALPQIYADPTKRLELYFRPEDPYCHPVCANRFSTSSLLLRVRRKTRRQKGAPPPDSHPEVIFDVEILGIVSTIYKFQGNGKMPSYCIGIFQELCPCCMQEPWVIRTVKWAKICPSVRAGP